MNVDEAVRQFGAAEEAPRAALQWALDHWETAAPRLVARLRAFSASPAARDEVAEGEIFFIVHLCGQMRESRAYAPLCRLIGESDEAIEFLGDAATETLDGILINVCDGDPHPLMGAIESERGDEFARAAALDGCDLLGFGEMGIGNTTSASAIAAVLTKQPIGQVTGCGTGLAPAGRARKLNVLRRSLKKHFGDSAETPQPLEILRCVGGLEIAAMTGFILCAAANRMAVVCDGFISTAAAAIAHDLAPDVRGYLFAGHCSEEPGHRHLLQYLGLTPILKLEMRLGEGTGAVLAMPVIESSVRLFADMATFSSAGVSTANE